MPVDHYGPSYGNFAHEVLAAVRREAFGEDIGQNGWQTAAEQDMLMGWLDLTPQSRLLDFACGAAGPALRLAEKTQAHVTGLDIDTRAIAAAKVMAAQRKLGARTDFLVSDGAARTPFPDDAFDALTCIDAVNHIEDRPAMLAEWRRILKPGARAVFTNPAVITGPVTGTELAIRSSIGAFLLTPAGADEAMLAAAGFKVIQRGDRTANMAASARGRLTARANHAADLIALEGQDQFDRQQLFFETAAHLAEERRLSRIAYCALRI